MFLVLITFVVYLWGKVQIEFILRKNDLLIREKITLQRRVNALRIEVNQKRRYERIVEMAKKQGLDFVSASCLKELPVDLKGLESDSPHKLDQVQYAGFSMNGI